MILRYISSLLVLATPYLLNQEIDFPVLFYDR